MLQRLRNDSYGSLGMTGDIREVARLGLVHHLLYPNCGEEPEEHAATLEQLCRRDDIETLDCCLPFDNPFRENAVKALQNCGKEKVFAIHFFPLRTFSLGTTSRIEAGICRSILRQMIDSAAEIGATGFIFASGILPAGTSRSAAMEAFRTMVSWLAVELGKHGIDALLEPFDTDIDKCFLYGASEMCLDLVESVAESAPNIGIELDIAHLPLMRESVSEAVKTVAPRLRRVHLGNCVLADPSHPRYGDTHPPIGLPGGEIDIPQLVETFRVLLDSGYLTTSERGALVMEMTPFPDKTPEETIQATLRRIEKAWQIL